MLINWITKALCQGGSFFLLMLNSHFFFFFEREREIERETDRKEKKMRYEARFPEVFFCRRDYLECLFLLSCLLPPPSGFCHRWPAWPGPWGQARAQVWGNRGLPASWEPWGWGWRRGRPAGGSQVNRERQGGAQPWTLQPFPLRPAPNLGEASTLRNGKLNCTF